MNLPFVEDKNKNRILRYRNMMDLYYWLTNFYKNITYYKLCLRQNNKTWVNINNIKYDDENILVYLSSLPINNDYNIGDIIGINEYCEIFNSYFIKDNFNDRLDLIYYNFIIKSIGKLEIPIEINGILVPEYLYYSEIDEWYSWLNRNSDTTDCCIKEKYIQMGGDDMLKYLSNKLNLFKDTIDFFKKIISEPYINIPIFLSTDIDEMGEFSLYSQQWIGGNRNYVGDVVIYVSEDDRNGSSYILNRGDEYDLIEMSDSFYESILNDKKTYSLVEKTISDIKKDCINEVGYILNDEGEIVFTGNGNFIQNNKKIIYYALDEHKCYLPLAYYCGDYDEKSKEIYFDSINKNGELNHWKLNSDNDSIKNLNIDGYNDNWDDTKYDLISQVDSKLLSLRRYKKSYDDNGNELPGILDYIIDNNKKIPNTTLDFIFEIGQAYNITKVIDEITQEKIYYGDMIKSIEYSIDNENFTKNKKNANFIKFVYYIGSKLTCHLCDDKDSNNDEWIIDETSGVRYEEVYNIKIGEILKNVMIDGISYDLEYDKIDFESEYITIYDEYLDFAPRKVILSNILTTSNQMFGINELNDTYNIINSLLYKEEYKMGVATPIKKDVNVYVDRGVNAAFERHLILGEINTYQDMENYRNNYFNFEQS